MQKHIIALIICLLPILSYADEYKLTGTIISTPSADTSNEQIGMVNLPEEAFDGNANTFFHAYVEDDSYSRPWVGLDLGEAHIITKIGFTPRLNRGKKTRLSVFQGANESDFSDAIPIAIVKEIYNDQKIHYLSVDVSRGFRYVRMVSAASAAVDVAELEFWGYPGDGDDSHFFQITNLPMISFNTPNMAQIKSSDDKHPGSSVYVVANDGEYLLYDNNARMKGRGNSSWSMDKKPFQIKFNKKQQILPDAPAKAKKWTLINNYGDKSLMRNKVAFEISRLAGLKYTPYCQFVDVVYNGEYQGCYQLCDQIEINSNRIDIAEMESTDIEGDALTGGYLLEIDAYASSEKSWFLSNKGIPVTIKSPDEDDIVDIQAQYITQHFNDFENAVLTTFSDDNTDSYINYLDLESFLRYFIVGELCGNTDTFWSVFLSKDRGDNKFVVGPIWDVDLGFDNDKRTYPISQYSGYLYPHASIASDAVLQLVNRIIIEDSNAREQLSQIWESLREDGNLTYEYLNNCIDTWTGEINKSQTLNFQRWPILTTYIHLNPRVLGSFSAEVNAIKEYLNSRLAALDEIIGTKDAGIVEMSTIPPKATINSEGKLSFSGIANEATYVVLNTFGVIISQGECRNPKVIPNAKGILLIHTSDPTAPSFKIIAQ